MDRNNYIAALEHLGMQDVARVGGKNASLGEMLHHIADAGVRVPGGFATTAQAYREFLETGGLLKRIEERLLKLNTDDVEQLVAAGREIRQWIVETPFSPELRDSITAAYEQLAGQTPGDLSVAVRSSATAEDLPEASFAGQQETFLNVRGRDAVLAAIKDVFASLYNDRAIAYRVHHGFDHSEVALSAGIQRMVRSDMATSGVMFTLDTETGFRDAVVINASYGLGESIVQGGVNPDEFYVYKPALAAGRLAVLSRRLGSKQTRMRFAADQRVRVETEAVPENDRRRFCLTDAEIEALARLAVIVENHYRRPMDIEWAKDGEDGLFYIVQARPETVQSRPKTVMERYRLKQTGEVIATGRAIGQRIASGPARVVHTPGDMQRVRSGDVLVADMTDPDWEPVMKRAAAIVTNRGGRTCHAAIIARELSVPAIVGCENATEVISDGEAITVSCAEGDTGYVRRGALAFEVTSLEIDKLPAPPVKIMMNVGNPERAFAFATLPNAGVGLARLEFIIARMIGVHPRALIEFATLPQPLRASIEERIAGYATPESYYVEKLAEGIATLAAAFAPKPVIVRLSDFKSNEYAHLLGGDRYEPKEENPMLGLRGASRYLAPGFRECFELECRAVRKVRNDMGLTNIEVMVPFVRTPEEASAVVALLADLGLRRGDNGLRLIMMCELPANALLADSFLQHFDGFSIGSNDLTQLTLALDRDSGLVANSFDERNAAVKALMTQAIEACRRAGKYIGICGQGPSDHPDLAQWLIDQGIESISLNPDTVVEAWLNLCGPARATTAQ